MKLDQIKSILDEIGFVTSIETVGTNSFVEVTGRYKKNGAEGQGINAALDCPVMKAALAKENTGRMIHVGYNPHAQTAQIYRSS